MAPPRRAGRPSARLFAFDRAHGVGRLAGADEAGRGCLAGPLVAAAVCLDLDRLTRSGRRALADLDDSKRLTTASRARLARVIWEVADGVSVALADAATIDREGLHRTNLRLLADALAGLGSRPQACLVDGFALGAGAPPHRAIPHGDATSAVIAAASVIAKVTRDRVLVERIAPAFPGYGFDRHMGYATAHHREAIRRLGPLPVHRRSFASAAFRAAPD